MWTRNLVLNSIICSVLKLFLITSFTHICLVLTTDTNKVCFWWRRSHLSFISSFMLVLGVPHFIVPILKNIKSVQCRLLTLKRINKEGREFVTAGLLRCRIAVTRSLIEDMYNLCVVFLCVCVNDLGCFCESGSALAPMCFSAGNAFTLFSKRGV